MRGILWECVGGISILFVIMCSIFPNFVYFFLNMCSIFPVRCLDRYMNQPREPDKNYFFKKIYFLFFLFKKYFFILKIIYLKLFYLKKIYLKLFYFIIVLLLYKNYIQPHAIAVVAKNVTCP